MIDKTLDYSWGRPDLPLVKSLGYTQVMRYLSDTSDSATLGKVITKVEFDSILANGLGLALNWEYKVGDVLGGASAGAKQARLAVSLAQALGYAPGCTIYFSDDTDTNATQYETIAAYFRAAAPIVHAAGYRLGAYGEYEIIKYLIDNGLIDDAWQTYAWSSGLWDSRAAMRQVLNNQQVAGASVDINERWGTTYFMGGPPMADNKTLVHTTYRQGQPWSCGPAALRIALTARGIFADEQTLIVRLGTTTDGTNSSAEIDTVYDEYINPNVNDFEPVFIRASDATADEKATFRANVIASINAGYALVVNVVDTGVDTSGVAHTYSGGHYIALVGYQASGAQVLLADNAIGKDYWIDTDKLATWIAERGYVWAAHVPVAPLPVPPARPGRGAPFPLPANEYFGDISGGNESHGGAYDNEKPYVAGIQQVVILDGDVPGVTDPNGGWADGKFEQPTIDAVIKYQAKHGLVQDGHVGPVTWSSMFPAPVTPKPVPAPTPTPVPVPVPTPPQPSPQEILDATREILDAIHKIPTASVAEWLSQLGLAKK